MLLHREEEIVGRGGVALRSDVVGGWRYSSDLVLPSDSSISGWAMLALKSCREAEIPVSDQTFLRLVNFFKSQEDPLTGRTHYQTPIFITEAMTGVERLARFAVRASYDALSEDARAQLKIRVLDTLGLSKLRLQRREESKG